jgi:hypothetical protein
MALFIFQKGGNSHKKTFGYIINVYVLIPISWQYFCCSHFYLNLHYFFLIFPNRNCQVKKIENKKNMMVGEGG